ncbi:MAG: type III-A CRISPR-associated RAMP protein Csm3 [Planctomycetes bacterium]|nr:type III-A CRISPR-associated RAMP protein Csm3 [Planctomycetota bacterium]
MQLDKRIFLNGYIIAETGLLIGGTDTGQGLSGADKVVLRNPINERPFIPGSSLKGKLRMLLEQLSGEYSEPAEKKSASDIHKKIARLLGKISDDRAESPRMLIIRDAKLANHKYLEEQEQLDMPYTELKTEVSIDRITAKATPHCYERVPAGSVFSFEMILSTYDFGKSKDEAKQYVELILTALLLLQDDYLGANGSRGYGKVKFHVNDVKMRDCEGYINNAEPIDFTEVNIPNELKLEQSALEEINAQISK